MAKKGESKALKRIAAPGAIPIKNKKEIGQRFMLKHSCGPHKMRLSMPFAFLLREHLGLASTMKEVKYIVYQGMAKIDGIARKKPDFPVGLMDNVQVGESNYLIELDSHGRLKAKAQEGKPNSQKLLKVLAKKTLKKGIFQLTFHDGRTLMTKDNSIKVGDTVVFSIKEKKIASLLPLKENSQCLIIEGKHAGSIGKVKSITFKGNNKEAILDVKGNEVITRLDYLFPVNDLYLGVVKQ